VWKGENLELFEKAHEQPTMLTPAAH